MYEKECLAILLAIDHWRSYLQHSEFVIRTDHKSLTHLLEQKVHTPIQQRAITKLMGLNFRIHYKQGQFNKVADALSRKPTTEISEILAISVCHPAWLDTNVQSYSKDPYTKQLVTSLSIPGYTHPDFTLVDSVLRFKRRIWVGSDPSIQHHIIHALHASALGGHSGFFATYHRVKRLFAWTNMKSQIKLFVQHCTMCQQAKSEHVALPRLLQPLDIPYQSWSLDLAIPVSTKLPPSVSVLQASQEPEAFLQRKLIKRGATTVARILVQWAGMPINMATWEDEQDL